MPQERRTRADLVAGHTPEAIRQRLSRRPRQSTLSDLIYGAIDGAVTTFAVVSGVAGAQLSPVIIVVLGVANLLADGFSMAAANFLGTRAGQQQLERARRSEEHELRLHPEGEREEIRQIFARKGIEGDVLDGVVDAITSDRDRWIETMMIEEHGLALTPRSPWRAAAATFVAFVIIGAIPLLPFLTSIGGQSEITVPFVGSAILTGAAFFLVGAMKSLFVDQRWWLAGLETLGVGGIAASIAYVVGLLLRGIATGM